MTTPRRTRSCATQVRILGQEYVISGDIDPDYVQRIAGYVEERMRRLQERTIGMSMTRLAVLAAMNIADELFTLQETLRQADELGSERAREMGQRVMEHLNEIERLKSSIVTTEAV